MRSVWSHAALSALLLSSFMSVSQLTFAAARTDGSIGAKQSFSGNFTVPASAGRQVGGNLFHSFATFDVARGESAKFAGPASIHNVLVRVTGGAASAIDGTLACSIPNADLFLINPAGVAFGADAKLDVRGSVTVTTADDLKFADGSHFAADAAKPLALHAAPPVAFGFLGGAGGKVTFIGNNTVQPDPFGGPPTIQSNSLLAVPDGRTLRLAAGSVQISGGTLRAPGGAVDLLSTTARGERPIDGAADRTPLRVKDADAPTLLAAASVVDVGGRTGGTVTIRGGGLAVGASEIDAGTVRGNGGGVHVRLAGPAQLDGGTLIDAGTTGPGRGGDVDLTAASLALTNGSGIRLATRSPNAGAGAAGMLRVRTTGDVALDGSSFFTTTTTGAGRGADLDVRARSITLTNASAIFANAESSAATAGSAGNLQLRADQFVSLDASFVTTSTFGPGGGGDLTIRAGKGVALSSGSSLSTGSTPSNDAAGRSGNVRVATPGLLTLSQSNITADTSGPAAGGTVDVRAGTLGLATGSVISTSTFSTSAGAGPGGSLRVNVRGLLQLYGVDGGSNLNASTFGPGRGGDVSVRAGRVQVFGSKDFDNAVVFTGITARSAPGSPGLPAATGGAGNVRVDAAGSIVLVDHGFISATSAQNGAEVSVTAGSRIALSGHAKISASAAGDGADLHVAAPFSITLTRLSSVTAESTRGNGGNVAIDPLILTLNPGSLVSANGQRNGGNVRIAADATPGLVIRGPGQNVTATGTTGTSGAVGTGPANTDVTNAIPRLPGGLAPPDAQLRPLCGEGGSFSSFLVSGNGGLSLGPGRWSVGGGE